MIIRHKVVAHQPKVKADHTGTVAFGTLTELRKDQFDELNDAYYNKNELYLFIVAEDKLVDFVKELGEDLINDN